MSLPAGDDLDSVRLVSPHTAAGLLDVSYRTILRLIERGELGTVCVLSRRRIPLTELRAYLARELSRGTLHTLPRRRRSSG